MHSTEAIKLTPEQWRSVAEFVSGIADLLAELLPQEETKTAGDARRIMGYAAAACIYVGEFAAEQCIFSIGDVKEEKNGADD